MNTCMRAGTHTHTHTDRQTHTHTHTRTRTSHINQYVVVLADTVLCVYVSMCLCVYVSTRLCVLLLSVCGGAGGDRSICLCVSVFMCL